jgi:hypothetical protein
MQNLLFACLSALFSISLFSLNIKTDLDCNNYSKNDYSNIDFYFDTDFIGTDKISNSLSSARDSLCRLVCCEAPSFKEIKNRILQNSESFAIAMALIAIKNAPHEDIALSALRSSLNLILANINNKDKSINMLVNRAKSEDYENIYIIVSRLNKYEQRVSASNLLKMKVFESLSTKQLLKKELKKITEIDF